MISEITTKPSISPEIVDWIMENNKRKVRVILAILFKNIEFIKTMTPPQALVYVEECLKISENSFSQDLSNST